MDDVQGVCDLHTATQSNQWYSKQVKVDLGRGQSAPVALQGVDSVHDAAIASYLNTKFAHFSRIANVQEHKYNLAS